MIKLFRFDKNTWHAKEIDYTYQIGIINNSFSLLWINYETPSSLIFSDGGLHILLSLFSNNLLGVDFQFGKIGLSIHLFSKYFEVKID